MVSDFKEIFEINQVGADTFTYAWTKEDLASGELVDYDFDYDCSFREVCIAVVRHHFDIEKVINHFADYSNKSLLLIEEY